MERVKVLRRFRNTRMAAFPEQGENKTTGGGKPARCAERCSR